MPQQPQLFLALVRTGEWLSLEGLVARQSGKDLGMAALEGLESGELSALLGPEALVQESAQGCYRHIAFLDREVRAIEHAVERRVKLEGGYERLMSVPGIGRILAMTIMLETGPISRFPGAREPCFVLPGGDRPASPESAGAACPA